MSPTPALMANVSAPFFMHSLKHGLFPGRYRNITLAGKKAKLAQSRQL